MAEKTGKKKPKKAAKASSDPGVLGNLPSTRPSRIGGERRTAATATQPRAATKAPATKATATAKASTAKPKAAAKPRAAAKPKAAPAPPSPRAGSPPPPRPESRREGRPSTTEVVTTAVQAAGELAQIGLTVGRQVLKRATDRLPRP